jgi:hypothetical protein
MYSRQVYFWKTLENERYNYWPQYGTDTEMDDQMLDW